MSILARLKQRLTSLKGRKQSTQDKAQRKYNNLLALKGQSMPKEIQASGQLWQHTKTFKHDFFAATGLYQSPTGRLAVLKIFRPHNFKGLPFKLLSVFQARHEEKIYRRLHDIPSIPDWISRYGTTGILHEYVPGELLTKQAKLSDLFFNELESTLNIMHERGISYLDTNKMDNILIGKNKKPYLFDFQLSWIQPPRPFHYLSLPLFAIFKNADLYHAKKHRHLIAHQWSRQQIKSLAPWYISLHRFWSTPLRELRRRYLRKVEKRATHFPEGTEKH